jgi:hypothetical protein
VLLRDHPAPDGFVVHHRVIARDQAGAHQPSLVLFQTEQDASRLEFSMRCTLRRRRIPIALVQFQALAQWGLANDVTATAQEVDSYDRATELERLGGTIIDLPADDWRHIAEAA